MFDFRIFFEKYLDYINFETFIVSLIVLVEINGLKLYYVF